jgi:integrase
MASIMYLPGRKLPWRAQVKRKGHPTLIKHFLTKDEAELWAAEQERSIRLVGLPLTVSTLQNHTVREIVEKYRDEVTPTKAGKVQEISRLNRFLNKKPGKDLCAKSLAHLSKKDGWDYIREREKQKGNTGELVTARTISRERNLFQDVFEVAKERWGYTNLSNPFRALKIKGSKHKRSRRLEDGEEERLLSASTKCHGLNKFFVPLAIDLAIETGMREQELFNLIWKDVDFRRRIIKIRKSKTDHFQQSPGRIIPLTWGAAFHFTRLKVTATTWGLRVTPSSRVFPMTQGAFMQTWNGVIERAGITDLQYRDLRHEAGSQFDEAGLSRPEIKLMLGHTSGDTTDTYINSDLKRIRDKLDLYKHDVTFEECFRDELAEGLSSYEILKQIFESDIGINVSSEAEAQELDKRVNDIERRENRVLKAKEQQLVLDQMRLEKQSEQSNVIKFNTGH